MKNFILSIGLLATVCANAVCAMEKELPGFEIRNGSKSPAKISVYYDI